MTRAERLISLTSHEVRHRREMMGISQESLAEMCGLHRTYIGAIERGERNMTLSTLLKLADALDCELSELIPTRKSIGNGNRE